eukprot:CCRYP_017590-RA/>CCRYP_017590-RA protein AED:0.11 eAED:0.11 QI:0/-1/0/1/-1/1/1/0/803
MYAGGRGGGGGAYNTGGTNVNTFVTPTFRGNDDSNSDHRSLFSNGSGSGSSHGPNNNDAVDFAVFQVKTGQPTFQGQQNFASIGPEIARPNSAPMMQSMDERFMSAVRQNEFDFEAFKTRIENGTLKQLRDVWSGSSYGGGGGNNSQDPYFKPSSEGRKKRSNSDPMVCESFFDAMYCGEVDDINTKRTRHQGVEENLDLTFQRSQSVDAVKQMVNLCDNEFKLDFSSRSDNNSDTSAGAFDDEHGIEPIELSFTNKQKRRNSEPLINAEFFNEHHIDFQAFSAKAQEAAAFSMKYANEYKRSSMIDNKKSSRQRTHSAPMFFEEFANSFCADTEGKNPNLFDSIHDVLGMEDSHSFDSDEEQKPSSKESSREASNFKRNNSAPLLSADFFDSVFDERADTTQKGKKQEDVDQDELDLFVQKMFTREKGIRHEDTSQKSNGTWALQRSKSLDAVSSVPTVGNVFPNDMRVNSQFALLPPTDTAPTPDESLALYNMLFSGENIVPLQNSAQNSFTSGSDPQAMCNQGASFNTNSNQTLPSTNDDATVFVLNAVKATQNQLQTLHPLVMKSGDTTAMEEIAHAFKITASASQYVLSSDLPNAVAVLSKAQSTIEVLWNRLSGKISLGTKDKKSGGNHTGVVQTHSVVSTDGVQLVNFNEKPRDSSNDSVCSSVTGFSNRSRSVSPANVRPETLFDCQSVASNKSTRSARSSRSRRSSMKEKLEKELPPQDSTNPVVIMERLKHLMERTQHSQKQLQKWDKKNGLPKSHSQTMVNSSRSRKQLQEGVVLKKWNGAPLIGTEKKATG